MKTDASVQEIMDSLRRIVRALRTASRESQKDIGLRAAQLFVLQQLREYEPLSLNELAEKTYSHQNTVSVVVDSLVKLGHVRRSASKKDRRVLVLETTPQGRNLLKRKQPTVQERFTGALRAMPLKKRKELSRLLTEFVSEAGLARDVPHFFFEK